MDNKSNFFLETKNKNEESFKKILVQVANLILGQFSLSQREFAEMYDTSEQHISRKFNGKSTFDLVKLQTVANRFGHDIVFKFNPPSVDLVPHRTKMQTIIESFEWNFTECTKEQAINAALTYIRADEIEDDLIEEIRVMLPYERELVRLFDHIEKSIGYELNLYYTFNSDKI